MSVIDIVGLLTLALKLASVMGSVAIVDLKRLWRIIAVSDVERDVERVRRDVRLAVRLSIF